MSGTPFVRAIASAPTVTPQGLTISNFVGLDLWQNMYAVIAKEQAGELRSNFELTLLTADALDKVGENSKAAQLVGLYAMSVTKNVKVEDVLAELQFDNSTHSTFKNWLTILLPALAPYLGGEFKNNYHLQTEKPVLNFIASIGIRKLKSMTGRLRVLVHNVKYQVDGDVDKWVMEVVDLFTQAEKLSAKDLELYIKGESYMAGDVVIPSDAVAGTYSMDGNMVNISLTINPNTPAGKELWDLIRTRVTLEKES